MSRTIRRKAFDRYYLLSEELFVHDQQIIASGETTVSYWSDYWGDYRIRRVPVEEAASNRDYEQYVARKKAFHHSDAGWGDSQSVPHWYCNELERSNRRKTKQLIHHANVLDAWDELITPRHFKDAGYHYW